MGVAHAMPGTEGAGRRVVCILYIPTLQLSILFCVHLVLLADKITHMSKLEN